MTATLQEIRLSNVGPVEHVAIPVPDGGGVVVLRGRNGRGKTKTLEAVESAITGRGKIEVRDGALKGEVDAFGVSIKVGRSTRRTGELEVQSLDGRLSVAELVDPGLKSPEAADAKRIKALVQLANVLPSADLFYGLVGGREQFDKLIGTSAMASDDLVTMAERIKRDLEAKARNEESQAEHAEGRARGAREAAAGVDLTSESDAAKLQARLESAIREESCLKAQVEASAKAMTAHRRATDALGDAEAEYCGPTLEEATEEESRCKTEVEQTEAKLRAAERALAEAKADHGQARTLYSQAIAIRKSAESHESTLRQWREQVETSIPVAPDAEQLAGASKAVTAARQAVEQGALVRAARQHLAEADAHAATAVLHRDRAEQLRDAARGTDEVLSDVVAKSGSQLRVEHGRLVLDTGRGATHFGELSMGERWKIALDIAIDALGTKGVLTIPQEAWEALDPINRGLIAEQVSGRGVLVLTAEATEDDEIQAEVYGHN